MDLKIGTGLNMYISIELNHTKLIKGIAILNRFHNCISVSLHHGNISTVCKQVNLKHITILNLAYNLIKVIKSECFSGLNGLMFLNMSFNKINVVANQAFESGNDIRVIDLSWNAIKSLLDNSFAGIDILDFLNLTGNPIVSVSSNAFSNTDINHIIARNYKVCCVKPSLETICQAMPIWPNSCGYLLGDSLVRMFIWCVACLGLILNIVSFLLLKLGKFPGGDSYVNIIACLAFSDTCFSISLLIVVIADQIFQENYLAYEYAWRSNVFCYTSFMLWTIGHSISIFAINLIAVARYSVVKDPWTSKFKEKSFVTKMCFFGSVLSILLATAFVLSYMLQGEKAQFPTGLCLIAGHNEMSGIPKSITTIILLSQVISCFNIPILYALLLKKTLKSKTEVDPSSKQDITGGLGKSVLVCLTNLSCWIPSSVLLCMTLFWEEYPYVLLIWTTMIITPLNTIVNPAVFVYFTLFRVWFKEKMANRYKHREPNRKISEHYKGALKQMFKVSFSAWPSCGHLVDKQIVI